MPSIDTSSTSDSSTSAPSAGAASTTSASSWGVSGMRTSGSGGNTSGMAATVVTPERVGNAATNLGPDARAGPGPSTIRPGRTYRGFDDGERMVRDRGRGSAPGEEAP